MGGRSVDTPCRCSSAAHHRLLASNEPSVDSERRTGLGAKVTLVISRGYDAGMCSQQEWESLRRRFEDALDEGQLREFAADALGEHRGIRRGAAEPRVRAGGRGLGSRARAAIADRVGCIAQQHGIRLLVAERNGELWEVPERSRVDPAVARPMSLHILYEVEALADIKRALFFDGRYDERDFPPGSIRRTRGNGLLEAFVMHVRCLDDFLYKDHVALKGRTVPSTPRGAGWRAQDRGQLRDRLGLRPGSASVDRHATASTVGD
jgi:hypothetical protein